MNVTTRNLLISIFCALLVGLIASTATPVVCAEEPYVEEEPYWGNLKAGDEMRWHWSSPSPMVLYQYGYYELKILEIRGEILKAYHNLTGFWYDGYIYRMDIIKCVVATFTSDELWPYIYPAALIQENEDIKMVTYEYNGSTYIGAYLKTGEQTGYLWDYSTGILIYPLEYTNASLTTPEMQYPPLLLQGFLKRNWIALVVVVALVSSVIVVLYRRKRSQKKKNT